MTHNLDINAPIPVRIVTAELTPAQYAQLVEATVPQPVRQARNTRVIGLPYRAVSAPARWKKPAVIAGSVVTCTGVLFGGGMALAATAIGHLIWITLGALLGLAAVGLVLFLLFGSSEGLITVRGRRID